MSARSALVKATFALVTALLATKTLEKAEEVAMLAFCCTMEMVCEAASCADLMPLEAEMDACWSCWLKVALRRMMVLDISTVALSTEAMMRLEQSCGLFWRGSTSWAGLEGSETSAACRGRAGVGPASLERDSEAGRCPIVSSIMIIVY